VRDNGRIVGGEAWQEKVYNREEWKKLLRMARNCHILHMPIERMSFEHSHLDVCSCGVFCYRFHSRVSRLLCAAFFLQPRVFISKYAKTGA
jgi:hypothetical protein